MGDQQAYFARLKEMKLKNPVLIGFGIRDKKTFEAACANSNGAIIGSAFVKAIENSTNLQSSIQSFVQGIKG